MDNTEVHSIRLVLLLSGVRSSDPFPPLARTCSAVAASAGHWAFSSVMRSE